MEQASAGKVLFFIPDISGFTKFVAETEITHSRYIIKALLEVLVDSNSIGLIRPRARATGAGRV